jgi:hypothetical protein
LTSEYFFRKIGLVAWIARFTWGRRHLAARKEKFAIPSEFPPIPGVHPFTSLTEI